LFPSDYLGLVESQQFSSPRLQALLFKTLTLTGVAVIAFSASLYGQQFTRFRAGLAMGYVIATGADAGGGGFLALEPGYHITDQILVNAKLERAVVVRGTDEGAPLELDYAHFLSGSINLQYFFDNKILRPFFGGGFGFYNIAAMTIDVSNVETEIPAESKLGFYPRAGFDVAHFTICIEYNLIPPSKVGVNEYKNNYVGIRIGGFFGGGRKN
jgi:hypothetical protein